MLSARPLGLSPADLLGVASVLLAFWFAVPQLLRLRRTGSAAGLSLESLANSTVSLVAWTLYGFAHGSMWIVASSLVGLPAIVATLLLGRGGGLSLRVAVPATWAGLLVVSTVVDVLAGTASLDVVLGCSILWFVAPAAWTAWRSHDVSGLAWQTWALLALEGLVFGLYGVVAGMGADKVYAVAALAGTAAVLSRLLVPSARPAPVAVRPSPFVRLLDVDDTRPLPPLVLEPA